jgi:hypothetical protein
MEDVLDLDAETPDPKRPVVCFDESPVQLIGEVREPIPPEPGQLERFDYEYRRNSTVNLFVVLDVNRPWRKVKLTERRTAKDYAQCMRELVDVHYPDAGASASCRTTCRPTRPAPSMRLSRPPKPNAFCAASSSTTPQTRQLAQHGGDRDRVLRGQCLDRRIDDPKHLISEVPAWERQRNAAGASIKWMFTTEKARNKLGRPYPDTSKES